MAIRFHDPVTDELKFKRRYVYAFWAFVGGLAVGLLMAQML